MLAGQTGDDDGGLSSWTYSPNFDSTVSMGAAGVGMGLAFGTLITIGLTGNGLVCVAIYANKKLRKKENLYFVSLAGADLFLCVLVMPFAAYNDIAGRWPFGRYCKIWMSLDIMCCTASILHLCAVSFDRCYHIHFPMQYEQRMTAKKILSAVLIVWTLSASIAFAPLAFEKHFDNALSVHSMLINSNSTTMISSNTIDHDLIDHDRSPSIDYDSSTFYRCSFNLEPTYAIISSMVSFYIPSCVMIVAYTKLYKYARRHAKSIRYQLKTATTFLISVAGTAPTKPEEKKRSLIPNGYSSTSAARRREIGASDSKARITLGVILGLFIFSWGPFFVCNIIRSFCGTCVPNNLFVALTWMGYANSAQNPIIYSIFNRDFRRAFSKILLCAKDRRKYSYPSVVVNEEFLIYENGDNRRENREYNYVPRRLSRLSSSEYTCN